MAELKPCPFCGARGDLDNCPSRESGRHLFWVECRGDECGISGRICGTPEAAAAAWNRRAPDGVPEARSTCALCGVVEPQEHKPECPTGQAERDLKAAYGVPPVDAKTNSAHTPMKAPKC